MSTPTKTTPFRLHVEKWQNCTRCALHADRQRVVLARGQIPADVLFVGEAPGEGEDTNGYPFAGPAGQLMDNIIAQAFSAATLCPTCRKLQIVDEAHADPLFVCKNGHTFHSGEPVRYCLTNLVGCIPIDFEGHKAKEPPDEALEACAPRVLEMIDLTRARLLVAVGRLAESYLEPGLKHTLNKKRLPMVALTHPAAILRGPFAGRSLAIRRNVVDLANALENL